MLSIKFMDFVDELFENSINSEFDKTMGKYKCNYSDIVDAFNTIRSVRTIDQLDKSYLICAIHRLTWYSVKGGVYGQTARQLLVIREVYRGLYAIIEDLETKPHIEHYVDDFNGSIYFLNQQRMFVHSLTFLGYN